VSDALRERRRAASPWLASPRALLAALRPRQWTKNGLIFVALAFTLNLQQPGLVLRSLVAFVCFCALSSAGYLLNDVLDAEADRQHPTKRKRPIASRPGVPATGAHDGLIWPSPLAPSGSSRPSVGLPSRTRF
jgi:heme O synthase-like polyprenyltransferase